MILSIYMDTDSLKKKYSLNPVKEKIDELEKDIEDAASTHKDMTQLASDL